MRILAIESSCDETSAAVLEQIDGKIVVLSNVTATSLDIHATTGGIIPENAARMQVRYIMPVIVQALSDSNRNGAGQDPQNWQTAKNIFETSIDAIAVTYGPGLIGSLLVGVETAKALSFSFDKPLIPVNHLLAHIYANFIQTPNTQLPSPIFPFIGLIVSGGHTDLLLFNSNEDYKWLGGTRDDAAGEAFDKIGRLLNLSYPAGPEIEKLADTITDPTVKFKSPLLHDETFDFSFSGLKTEVLRFVQKTENMDDNLKNQICYATQKAIVDVLVKKTIKATEKFGVKTILVGGGVSANETFGKALKLEAAGLEVMFPKKEYSTDNAAMVGAYAFMNFKAVDWKNVNANPELYFA